MIILLLKNSCFFFTKAIFVLDEENQFNSYRPRSKIRHSFLKCTLHYRYMKAEVSKKMQTSLFVGNGNGCRRGGGVQGVIGLESGNSRVLEIESNWFHFSNLKQVTQNVFFND
jgi:hypothetical protein